MVLRELLRRGLLDAEVRPAVGVAVDEERDQVSAVALAVRIAVAGLPVILGGAPLVMSVATRYIRGPHDDTVFF